MILLDVGSCNRDYSAIHLSVFHRMRSSTQVKSTEVTSTPATKANIPPTLQLLSSVDAEEFLLSLPELYQDPDLDTQRENQVMDYCLPTLGPQGYHWMQGAHGPMFEKCDADPSVLKDTYGPPTNML